MYMDRNDWIKTMMHFKTFCGANKLNTHVLLYDGHDRHFDDRSIHIIRSHHITPFILKSGDPVNDQTNYNGTKLKPKGLNGQS